MRTRRRVVAAKIEAAEGTAENIAAADGGILAVDPKVDVDIRMVSRGIPTASLGKLQELAGVRLARATFRAELKGPGTAYAAGNVPALGKYLRACGFAETVDVAAGAEKVSYDPASDGIPSLTLHVFEDGVIKKLKGCRGTVKIAGKVGEPVYLDFEFVGVWDGLVDGSMLAPAFEGTVPPLLMAAGITLGAYSPVLSSFEVNMGNVLAPRESANAEAGVLSTLLTDRDPRGSFDPEMTTKAVYDWFGLWQAGTTAALNVGPVGAVQYNKVAITAPKLVKTKVTDGEREGTALAETQFQLAIDSGDDEIQIEFS